MDKQHTQAEADIIFNRANIALARSQALIESWLPPATATKSEPEDDLKNEPETLGVGAQAKDDDFTIKRRPADTKLLEQLIGKKAARGHMSSKSKPPAQDKTKLEPRPEAEGDSDSEAGRAATIKKRPKRKRNDAGEDASDEDMRSRPVKPETTRSYLDDVLAAKSKKAGKGRTSQ